MSGSGSESAGDVAMPKDIMEDCRKEIKDVMDKHMEKAKKRMMKAMLKGF